MTSTHAHGLFLHPRISTHVPPSSVNGPDIPLHITARVTLPVRRIGRLCANIAVFGGLWYTLNKVELPHYQNSIIMIKSNIVGDSNGMCISMPWHFRGKITLLHFLFFNLVISFDDPANYLTHVGRILQRFPFIRTLFAFTCINVLSWPRDPHFLHTYHANCRIVWETKDCTLVPPLGSRILCYYLLSSTLPPFEL